MYWFLTLILGYLGKCSFSFFFFPCGSAGKESACNVGDLGSIPGLGRSLGEGKGYPLQYSGLENSKDCLVHVVAKSWTRLSDFRFLLKQIDWFSYIKETCLYIQYLKIHQFKVYGSVMFSTFTELFSQQHSIILEHFQYPRKKLFMH